VSKSARYKTANLIQDRLIDEMIGICRGVIADGTVDEQEAIFLGQWIENHREIADRWPVNILYARLTEMLKDGILSAEEQAELLATLRDITGESATFQEPNRSTTLPFNTPAPDICFAEKTFYLTGRFVFGSIIDCEETITELGGILVDSVTQETDYLVVGELCSPDWVHTTFGRSIENAVEMRSEGALIAIVSEEHWVNSL
jgi:NAD-dependent DNA ligase